MEQIRDWKRPICQFLLLLFIISITVFVDLIKIIDELLQKTGVAKSELDVKWRIGIGLGKYVIGAILFIVVLRIIRKSNKDEVLEQSDPNCIVWHSFPGYWLCSKILNYQTVSLVRVPIPVQFRLICRNYFKKYVYNVGITTKEQGQDTVVVRGLEETPLSSTVNLVLIDTYPIDYKRQLPGNTLQLSTIVVDRSSSDRNRYYSKDFVAAVVNTVRSLPTNVVEINLFATMNPANCYHVATEAFCTGGRDQLKKLRVYQQSAQGDRVFEGSNVRAI